MGISWDTIGVGSGPNVALADIIKDASSGNVVQPETNLVQKRHERLKAEHKAVSKDVSKYHHIIKTELEPAPGETIVLGAHRHQAKPKDLVAADLPEFGQSATEEKLRAIVEKLHKGRRAAAERLFPKAAGHSEAEAVFIESRLRQLMAAELRDATRVKAIKSKDFRRRRRKADERAQAKLMEQLLIEDPEAAEALREEWEVKRAEARLQLGSRARRTWAKMARRFGGKDMERTINAAHMDAEHYKEVLDRMSGKPAGGERDVESSDDGEDDADTDETRQKGIWAMPFMQRARELKKIAAESGIDLADDFEVGGSHLPDESECAENFLARKRAGEKSSPAPTDAPATADAPAPSAAPTDEKKFSIATGSASELDSATTRKPSGSAAGVDADLDLMAFITRPEKPKLQPKPEKVEEEDDFNAKFFVARKSNKRASAEMNDGSDPAQSELVHMAFSADGVDSEKKLFEEQLVAEQFAVVDKAHENDKMDVMPGWGSWSAENYEDPRVTAARKAREAAIEGEKVKKLAELKRQGLFKVHPSACKPSDKYLVNYVPKNFKSGDQLTRSLKSAVSDQFVPSIVSKIASAPKQQVIRGRVISALKSEIW